MIASVAREFKWPPEVLGGLFFDAEDYEGLMFWYNDIKDQHKELKSLKKK